MKYLQSPRRHADKNRDFDALSVKRDLNVARGISKQPSEVDKKIIFHILWNVIRSATFISARYRLSGVALNSSVLKKKKNQGLEHRQPEGYFNPSLSPTHQSHPSLRFPSALIDGTRISAQLRGRAGCEGRVRRERAIRESERRGRIIGRLARGARLHSTSNYVITSKLTRGWGKGNLLSRPTCN